MFIRMVAIIIGIAFVFGGVAGFLPTFITDGLLFGYFEVNNMHNLVHIVTGVLAIMAATSYRFTILFFQIFGFIYTIMGVWGFFQNGDLYVMHVNTADNVLHVVVGVIGLYLGLAAKRTTA